MNRPRTAVWVRQDAFFLPDRKSRSFASLRMTTVIGRQLLSGDNCYRETTAIRNAAAIGMTTFQDETLVSGHAFRRAAPAKAKAPSGAVCAPASVLYEIIF